MKKIFLIIGIVIALFLSGCITPFAPISEDLESSKKKLQKEKIIIKNNVPLGYKLLELDELHISIAVPKSWKLHKEKLHGQTHYFIGWLNDTPQMRIDKAEIWDTFLSNPFNIHGVHIQTIDATPKSIETELSRNTLSYNVISDKNLSNNKQTIRSVLKKNIHNGYYQFYVIGSKNNPRNGLMIELVSKLYSDEKGETKFDDSSDIKEIQTIINSIKPYENF